MENRKCHVYTLICPVDRVVRYIGCTSNPKVRLGAHISGAKISVTINNSNNRKDVWIYGLLMKGMKPIMEIVYSTNNIELASDMEVVFYNKYNHGQLLCTDPSSHRYNNQLGNDTIKWKRINSFIRKMVCSGEISKEDLFDAIYSKSRMSFKNSYHRIDNKLTTYFSDQDICKIYIHLSNLGIELPRDLPFNIRHLLNIAS